MGGEPRWTVRKWGCSPCAACTHNVPIATHCRIDPYGVMVDNGQHDHSRRGCPAAILWFTGLFLVMRKRPPDLSLAEVMPVKRPKALLPPMCACDVSFHCACSSACTRLCLRLWHHCTQPFLVVCVIATTTVVMLMTGLQRPCGLLLQLFASSGHGVVSLTSCAHCVTTQTIHVVLL